RGGDAPFTNPGAVHDPLVRCVDDRRELVVRQNPLGCVRPEPRDRDWVSFGFADHFSTAKVRTALQASSPPTRASALPRPTGPRTRSSSQRSYSTSPGSTMRLKRHSSLPAKKASLPRFSSSLSTATAP